MTVGDFAIDTAIEGAGGHYRAILSPDWEVWGPMGGYRAAIALRAIGRASRLGRPASFVCQFLAPGRSQGVEITVTTLLAARRAELLRAVMTQGGSPLLDATAWVVDRGLAGFEHDLAVMPAVPGPETLRGYQDLDASYPGWYPFWRNVEGRPILWTQERTPPVWHTWIRLLQRLTGPDAFLDAARSVLWLDLMMWNAVQPPHGRPPKFLAPNLDLTCQFVRLAPDANWMLCDSAAPVAGDGLAPVQGRLWTRDGRLVATGSSQLLCRPNPEAAG